jgi:CDP-diacylglycerol--serine O-phosphatidyltransferase
MSAVRPQPDPDTTGQDRAPAERRGLKKGLYLVPSLFTAVNIFAGFYSVMSTMRGFQFLATGRAAEAPGYFDYAAIAIGWAVLCDILDGRVARMTRTTTEIGIQLDSIADVVSFGVAPALLAYVWGYGTVVQESNAQYLSWFLSFVYLICGGFRLARFNVQASRPRLLAEGKTKVDKKSFVGLPIPVAGGMIAAIVHLEPTPLVQYFQYEPHRAEIFAGLMMVLVGCLSVLMVSTMRFSSLKTVGTTVRSARVIILTVAMAVLIYLYSRWILLVIASGYILHGLLSRLIASVQRRQEPARVDAANPDSVGP